jgi:hypothetical protein
VVLESPVARPCAANGAWGRRSFLSTKPKAKLASPSMVLDGIRRLAVADLDETALERLAAHGEDLFVERKRAIPNDGIGRTVAAFANSLGGWLLLGVANDGTLSVSAHPGGRTHRLTSANFSRPK